MGYINGKIYKLRKVLLFLTVMIISTSLSAQHDESEQIKVYKLRFPFYQEKRDIPVIILYAKEARPIGVRFELTGVRVDWIGDTVKDVKGVVTTHSAVYDKSTQQITGNEPIHYRSDVMDLDGIGFDIDQVEQILHIRENVKLVLKQRLQTARNRRESLASGGKISIDKSRKNMLVEEIQVTSEPIDVKEKDIQKSINEKRSTNFDWTGWFWFAVMAFITGFIIKFIIKSKKRRESGGKSGNTILK